MPTMSRPWSFVAGDDWFINVVLRDDNDQPYHLDNLTEIKWLLHNPSGEIVEHDFILSKTDAASGALQIWIPNAETTGLAGGTWVYWLRIICGGIVSTLLTGQLLVTADPWRAPVAVAPMMAMSARSVGEVVVVLERERIRRMPRRAVTSARETAADTDRAIGTGRAGRAARSGA